MMFFREGETPFPRKSHGIWAMAQYQRLGLLKDAPPYQKIVDSVVLTDLYEKAAGKFGIDVPNDDMKPFDLVLDKATFDPKKPDEEVKRP
jgi:nitrate/nitrite transport system substrate-binding protein